MIDNDGDMLYYNPYQYRCCLFMATPGNGVAAAHYAPSTVTVRVGDDEIVEIREETLTYSLKIAEKWKPYGVEKWAAHELYPASAWNCGLMIDPEHPEPSVHLARRYSQLAAQPFALDSAPIELSAKAKRIANWKQEQNGFVGLVPANPVTDGSGEEEITLVPMGCARLRVSAFPTVQ